MEDKHNKEIRGLFEATDITVEARSRRLRWAGHIIRRDEKVIKLIWKETPEGRKLSGRPRKIWKEELLLDMNKCRVNENAEDNNMKSRQMVSDANSTFDINGHGCKRKE